MIGLLHAWEGKDSSLFTNALVYSPPSAPDASPWPGLVGRTSASMILVAGPPVPTSEVAFRALRAAPSAPIGTAVHRRDTGDAAASHTGGLCTWHCTGSRPAVLPMVSVLSGRQERDRRLLDQAHAAEECVASRAHVK